jgi:hypothetical protein
MKLANGIWLKPEAFALGEVRKVKRPAKFFSKISFVLVVGL